MLRPYVVRDDETIHGKYVLLRVIWAVRVAAGGDGAVFALGYHQCKAGIGKHAVGYGLCPGIVAPVYAEHGSRVAKKVFVEIASAYDVIALAVLGGHVFYEHFQLLLGYLAVGGVGGEVQVVEHQLAAVIYGYSGYGVAAVQIHQLHKARLYREAYAQCGSDAGHREGHDAGKGAAVGLNEGIEQEG